MGHQHHHDKKELRGRRIVVTIALNMLITFAQIIGGIVANSMSLLSDAMHNFSDVISLIISYIANMLSSKKNTDKRTFGYKRAEVIAAFINSATLILIAFILGKEAIERFSEPEAIGADIVIYMAIFSIVINAVSVLILKNDAKENMNMKSAYLHLFSDVITSVAVMLGGIAMKLYNIYWLDGVLTIIIAVYLLIASWKLFIQSLKVLMQFVPSNININEISNELSSLRGVINVHHLHVWQLSEDVVHFECHIDLEKDIRISEFEEMLPRIRSILAKSDINHFNIQPEYMSDDNKDIIVQE